MENRDDRLRSDLAGRLRAEGGWYEQRPQDEGAGQALRATGGHAQETNEAGRL
jgi:hypothetical protein